MNRKIDRPRAAVIVIAYNDETHIERAIQSVCDQTESNIEIICVDDGSADSTYENMRRFANRDGRIRVISQTNAGALGARYAGLQQVTSDYVLFLDSDDTFMPEAVETACAAADEIGADVLEFGVSLVGDESNPPTQETWMFSESYFSQKRPLPETDHGPELVKACFAEHAIAWNIWNKLYRTELLRRAFRFYQGEWVSMEEDMLLTLMVLCQAERYARIPQKLYAYTIGGGISTTASKITSPDALKKVASEGLALKLAREWINKLGCTQNEVMSGMEALTEFIRGGILLHMVRRVAAEQRREYLSLLSQNCERNEYYDLVSEAISHQQARVIQIEEQNADLGESLKQQQLRIAQLEKQNAGLGESLKQQQLRIAQLEDMNLQLHEAFDTISNAQFWKMTAPIRKVLDTVKMAKEGRSHSSKQDGMPKESVPEEKERQEGECGDREAYSFTSFLAECEMSGAVFGRESLSEMTGRDRVLLVSHEVDLSGAPIALLHFAKNLKKRGMAPVFIAPRDGKLKKKILDEGIPVIVCSDLYCSDLISRAASCFDLIIVNTVVGAPLIGRLRDSRTPVLWWIHEAQAAYRPEMVKAMPEQLGDNIHVYCVGKRADKWLHTYRDDYRSENLFYCQPDFPEPAARSVPLPPANGKTVFLTVGTIEERKGQDILADAIAMLPEKELEKCQFLFVGRERDQLSLEKKRRLENRHPENVCYLGEMDVSDMPAVYQRCDCLICPSRDDPAPTTVSEALSLSKIVICSENTGHAALLKRDHSGLIYPDDDPKALSESILYVLHNMEKLGDMRAAARKTYESHFSESVFGESVSRILTRLFRAPGEPEVIDARVSVIVPVWNGGEDLKRLLGALRAQLGIESIEMVIVDSGSSDRSAEYAESAGAKVIQIPHAEFSHSHARNLGARHASGEYLLFMTQDACPSGPYWLRGMLRPIVRQGVAAVSCREEPRPGCDLLGRVNIFNHSVYMGILSGDRIMQMPDEAGTDTLRKNAQINDIACLIRKDVFDKYHYRGNYAEDLDLGLRLIRDGHRLALLSGVHVIHSHNRPAMYYFKRGIVDVSTVNDILPGSVEGSCQEQYAINRILTAYCVMRLYIQEARQYKLAGDDRDEWNRFREWTARKIDSALAAVRGMKPEERNALMESEGTSFDADFHEVILEMLTILRGDFSVEPTTVNEIKHCLVNVLDSYFAYEKEPFSDPVVDEICILAEKFTGLLAGSLVGTCFALNKNENSELNRLAKRYAQGI